MRLATIIHEGLPDLVNMPSAPPSQAKQYRVGGMKVLADGEVVGEHDIKVGPPTGAEYAPAV
jgi:hypothetical protein